MFLMSFSDWYEMSQLSMLTCEWVFIAARCTAEYSDYASGSLMCGLMMYHWLILWRLVVYLGKFEFILFMCIGGRELKKCCKREEGVKS